MIFITHQWYCSQQVCSLYYYQKKYSYKYQVFESHTSVLNQFYQHFFHFILINKVSEQIQHLNI